LCQDLQDLKILLQEKTLKNLRKKKKLYNFSPPTSIPRCTEQKEKKKRKMHPDFEKDVFEKSLKEMGNCIGTAPETFSWKEIFTGQLCLRSKFACPAERV